MGNTPVKIGIRLESTVEAGAVMKGRVYLSIKRVGERAHSLNLLLEGEEEAEIVTIEKNENRLRKKLIDRASSVLYKSEVPLKIFSSGKISRGQYEYPFEWPLLDDLPSYMACQDGESFCQIKYKLTAYLDNQGDTGITSDRSSTIPLTVNAASILEPQDPVQVDCAEYPMKSCFTNQGSIKLGFDVDTAIAAPRGNINVGVIGKNDSVVNLKNLTARVVETVTWSVAGRNRTSTRTLCTAIISPLEHSLWNPLYKLPSRSRRARNQQRNNEESEAELYDNRLVVQLLLPADARDTYQGNVIGVRHAVVVEAITPRSCCATSPESSMKINIQRIMPTMAPIMAQTPTAPQLFLDDQPTIELYQTPVLPSAQPPMAVAELLPEDWKAHESEVFIIPTAATIQQPSENIISADTDQTAEAVPSAPQEFLLQQSNQIATSLTSLKILLSTAEKPTTVLELELRKPEVARAVEKMAPHELVETLRASCHKDEDYPPHARMLACAMVPNFYCRHVLACLWGLSRSIRFEVIKEIAPLAADVDQQREMVERELDPAEAAHFRLALA